MSKVQAKRTAKAIARMIKGLNYHKWDGSKFVRIKDLRAMQHLDDRQLLQEREKFKRECLYLDSIQVYINYITAPSDMQAEGVMEDKYLRARKKVKAARAKKGLITNELGYLRSEHSKQVSDYEAYEYLFKQTCEELEKALSESQKSKHNWSRKSLLKSMNSN